jgi:2,3-bisphosphoglycerate-independent phosphoglycerate mutase
MKKPLALIILDGYGKNEDDYGNAIAAAETPCLDELFKTCPNTLIGASGLDVGLPIGQMGNSEVGHTNIGAGRVVYQELVRISKAIGDGDFFENKAFLKAVANCKTNDKALHLIGLLSDGGVHSHNEHLYGLLHLAKKNGLTKVYVHALLDGRDVSPTSGKAFMEDCVKEMQEIGVGEIATVTGRYYAMDRDNAWDRVEKAYSVMVYGVGDEATDPVKVITDSYAKGVTDEFVNPTIINKEGTIDPNDSVIFFNYRPDRARQITRTFVDENFVGFQRKQGFFPLTYVCMTQYDATMPNVLVAFEPKELTMTLGEYISKNGLTQLRIAETQKYAHVTFFFNGGEEKAFEGEDRVLVQSPDVPTFDLKPEMSAFEVADKAVDCINSGKYDVIILNFANCDMVGHTGIFDAAKKAVEAVDFSLSKVIKAILENNGIAIVTADHGNAEKLYEKDGSPFTAHTIFPVPVIVVGHPCKLKNGGKLADLAPTMLEILNLKKPSEMDGESLLV